MNFLTSHPLIILLIINLVGAILFEIKKRYAIENRDPDARQKENSFGLVTGSSVENVFSDEEKKSMIEFLSKNSSDAIAFRHVFPPQHDHQSLTYFGGRPTVPVDFKWPRTRKLSDSKSTNTPLTFLAQIDCSELPVTETTKILPTTGILYFYFDWEQLETGDREIGRNVFYLTGDKTHWVEMQEPDDTPPVQGEEFAEISFPWLSEAEAPLENYPRHFEKWQMDLGLIKSPPFITELHRWESDSPQRRTWNLLKWKYFHEFLSDSSHVIADKQADAVEVLDVNFRYPNYPIHWLCVEVFCGYLLDEICRKTGSKFGGNRWQSHSKYSPDPDALMAGYQHAISCSNAFIEKARTIGRYIPLTADERDNFRNWVNSMAKSAQPEIVRKFEDFRKPANLNHLLALSAKISADYALSHSAESASRVSNEAVSDIRNQHRMRWDDGVNFFPTGCHQMLGSSKLVQVEELQLSKDHVILLQLDSDSGLNWLFGDVGIITFWISRRDLAKKRFENVITTFEGF